MIYIKKFSVLLTKSLPKQKTLPKFNKFLVTVLITQDFKECNYGKA